MEDLKVGDRVEVMNVWSWYMGQFGVVKKVNKHVQSNTTYYSVLLDAEMKAVNFDKCELRLAAKKAAPTTFKIGDKVFINEKCTAYKDLVGKHGIVTDVAVDMCKVEFGANDYVWITDKVLTAEAVQFKIGDLVIVRDNVPCYSGCKGKVVDVYGSIRTIVVELVKNGIYCRRDFLADELALDIDEIKHIDKRMMKHFGRIEWKIGDNVIVVSNTYGPKVYGMKGKIEKIAQFGNCYVMLECGEGRCEGLWFDGKELSRYVGDSNAAAKSRVSGSDIWHVNVAELAGRTVSGCRGLAFGEEL